MEGRMSIWNKVFGKTEGNREQATPADSRNSGDPVGPPDEQILKQLARHNAAKVNDLNEIFRQTEEMLSKMEIGSYRNVMDQELIDLLIDMIYRSAVRTFITSVQNSFFKHKSMPMEYYDMVKPLMDRWRSVLDSGINLNQQSLVDFVEELDEFTTNCPEFIVNSNADNGGWTLSTFYKEGIWEPYFKSIEDKAIVLCNRMRKLLESRGDNIEVLINSGYSLISPFEFEDLVATLFNRMGYETEVTSKTGDYGIDIIAKDENDVIAIQTKKYATGNNVGNRDVQRLLGAMQLRHVKANKAILITTSDFTLQAVEQAKETPIELWDGAYISSLLRKYLKKCKEGEDGGVSS
jgi:restriction system protein